MAIKIGKIENRELEKVCQFCQSIFAELKWDKKFAYGLKNLKKFFGRPKEIFLLAKEGERIIACGGLKKISDREALLKRFYVAKDFRGEGLADVMLKRLKSFAKEKNYKSIVVDIFRNNLRAKKFFQRRGFSVFSPTPDEGWPETKYPEMFEFRKLNLNKN